ncbi:3-hydroxybutyrate dehydrogenase [Telmatocola sphagniphila]|uniref:3-hydroxybutyrate dehydrogenase n=1 Tax=Telmatocola sphagniphila TaxID=1123043 RepID=A0A8E6B841_9BACT|nr:3-hydroxybutyrate dehydrogenase [Telmatocola sphagniphila]QVL33496.1 3-hydroxybutyrate dehydrogenase [Telmatocola sphagniphila]
MKPTILITGAGSGIGRGLAVSLAAQGHFVGITDFRTEAAQETCDIVRNQGHQAEALGLDVTDLTQISQMLAQNWPISVLINNAGLQCISTLEEFPIEKWDLLTSVMVKGTFQMTQALLPGMRERGFGRLIHIGSIHSLVASPFKSAYVAAKHAIVGFSKTVALETGNCDITSNVLCPAYVRTALVEKQIADQARTRNISEQEVVEKVMLAPCPKKRFIEIEELVWAVNFLISPLARNITGQTLVIDGGWTAQ